MRKLGVALALLPSLALAGEGILGTKAGGGFSPAEPTSAGAPPLLQTLVAIAIVVALLKYGLPKLAKWIGAKETTGGIRVEESAPLAGGHLHVVAVRGRTLLVGASSHGFTALADLTDVSDSAGLRGQTSAEPRPLFMDMVSAVEPFQPHSAQEPPSEFPSASAELLARFDRLTGRGHTAQDHTGRDSTGRDQEAA